MYNLLVNMEKKLKQAIEGIEESYFKEYTKAPVASIFVDSPQMVLATITPYVGMEFYDECVEKVNVLKDIPEELKRIFSDPPLIKKSCLIPSDPRYSDRNVYMYYSLNIKHIGLEHKNAFCAEIHGDDTPLSLKKYIFRDDKTIICNEKGYYKIEYTANYPGIKFPYMFVSYDDSALKALLDDYELQVEDLFNLEAKLDEYSLSETIHSKKDFDSNTMYILSIKASSLGKKKLKYNVEVRY